MWSMTMHPVPNWDRIVHVYIYLYLEWFNDFLSQKWVKFLNKKQYLKEESLWLNSPVYLKIKTIIYIYIYYNC